MPPPIEEEEEEDIDPDDASCSEQSWRDDPVPANAGVLIDTSHGVHSRVSPERVVSDLPLVVSDIQPTKEMAASEPVSQEFGRRETSMKRKTPPKRTNYSVTAKRRKGNSRALPCVYCARRLANDPQWKCHDALGMEQKLFICLDESLACQFRKTENRDIQALDATSALECMYPAALAVGPVKALMRASEEVNKHDGSQNIAVLAAYEAAIGPALRAMAGIGLQSSTKVNEPKKSRPPKSKKKGKDRRTPSEGDMASSGTLPQASTRGSELGGNSTRSRPGYEGGVSQGGRTDSRPLSKPLQANRGQDTHNMDPAAFQKMERQALRRRKVEALESLSHTAALFLAEFIDFKKGRQEPPANASPPPGLERHQAEQSAGAAYAAAAASLFRPLSEEFDRSGYNSGGSVIDQPSSSYDNSVDEEIPAETPSEQEEGMDMDEGGTRWDAIRAACWLEERRARGCP